ncbi:MAG: D-alanyl-D-alanine carboxypeptidase [Defluviitaleaceae bacterium]|nr:D-alanyl-D-alanine carboxypeptidase [Defluviitaleaceae bacterium]
MRKISKILIYFLIIAIASGIFAPFTIFADDNEEAAAPPLLNLEAPFGIIVCAATGVILHENGDINAPTYPASMTKVMTALLLIESGADLTDRIFHSRDAVFSIPRNSSHIYMSPSETLTVLQALYAIMLPSANDVSNAIAEFVAGDMETFAQMMTNRAHELGAVNTNFTNAHGLHDPNHVTTLYDMHLIMREAIRHDVFVEVINTPRFIIHPTELQPEPRIIDNTNLLVRPTMPQFSPIIVGGKTGWTTPAGHTLVTYGKRDGIELISVVMSAPRREIIFADTIRLMNYGFSQFETHNFYTASDFSFFVDLVQRSDQGTIIIDHMPVYAANNAILPLPNTIDPQEIQINYTLPNRLTAPIAENTIVGRISLTLGDRIIHETELRTAREGNALNQNDLTSLSTTHIQQNIANIIYNTNDPIPLPNWLTTPGPFLYIIAIATSLLITAAIIKFLRFTRRRKNRRNIYRKSRMSKSYKYR